MASSASSVLVFPRIPQVIARAAPVATGPERSLSWTLRPHPSHPEDPLAASPPHLLPLSPREGVGVTTPSAPAIPRVAEKETVNKMSLHNLATVFGPTLLRPSEKESKLPANPGQPIAMTDSWSLEVMSQVCSGEGETQTPPPVPRVVPTHRRGMRLARGGLSCCCCASCTLQLEGGYRGGLLRLQPPPAGPVGT